MSSGVHRGGLGGRRAVADEGLAVRTHLNARYFGYEVRQKYPLVQRLGGAELLGVESRRHDFDFVPERQRAADPLPLAGERMAEASVVPEVVIGGEARGAHA